jgi:MFS family permease
MQQARIGRWAVGAMFLVNGFTMGAWAPQIPLLLPRHNITELTLGLLILALGIGAVGAMVFAGRLINIFGSRQVLRTFAMLLIPILPAVVFAPNIPLLALAMVLFGAFTGCMDVAMNANAVIVERSMGRAIMSSSHGFWSLGGFIGGIFGGQLLAAYGAEIQSLWAAGCAAVVVTTASLFLMPDAPAPKTHADEPRPSLLPRDGALWLIGLMALFSMVPEGAILDWAALYMTRELGGDPAISGYAFGLFSGAMAVLRFAGDGVRNRFGAVRTLQVSGLIAAVGLLGGAVAPNAWVAILSFGFAGLGVANMVPVLFSAAGNHPGLSSGAGIAAVTMVGYSGILVAPASIGFIAEHIGYRWTYGSLATLAIFVALMAHRARAADDLRGRDEAQAALHDAPM